MKFFFYHWDMGIGLGLQFGLEADKYLFILQNQESINHFGRGDSFAIGGNIGAHVPGIGCKVYGAASVGACLTIPMVVNLVDVPVLTLVSTSV